MNRLNIIQPNIVCRVTQYMPCIVDFIQGIENRGFAYKAENGNFQFYVFNFISSFLLENFGVIDFRVF